MECFGAGKAGVSGDLLLRDSIRSSGVSGVERLSCRGANVAGAPAYQPI